ncbi:hypothetical protein V4F39_00590 [Aquincola sp. MAHUQ-54]|uniref:Tetratricopeptide repeat protein n=1 Tax=Aquincola agrisoli TaxID=3119538 RepID=A0AAW9PZ25_9BURK
MRTSLRALLAALLVAGFVAHAGAQQLRPEVGRPLQQAGELLKAGKAREALAKVREADAAGNKTAAEQLLIERMRGAAAQRAGDAPTAIAAFEAVFASGKLSAAEQGQIAESLAFAYSQAKNWPKTTEWAQRARQAGSNSQQLQQLLAYVQAQSGDYAAVARDAASAVSAAEQAGRRPAEDDLLRLADAYQRTNNAGGHAAALEKLILHYPKKDYWSAYLNNVQRKPGFSSRLSLDVMRLKLANGLISTTEQYMEMAQLSLQAGLPDEAKAIVERGFAAGALGTGTEAERHKRLRELVLKQEAQTHAGLAQAETAALAAKDGNELVKVGTVYVSMGQAAKGAGLIEKGIAKGQLKRPDDAKLRLGWAQLQSPQTRTKGLQTLRGVGGNDGTAEIARAWAALARQG